MKRINPESDFNKLIRVIHSCRNKLHVSTCNVLIKLYGERYSDTRSVVDLKKELDVVSDKLCL